MDDRAWWAGSIDRSVTDRRSADAAEMQDPHGPARRVRAGGRDMGRSARLLAARARRAADPLAIDPAHRMAECVSDESVRLAPGSASPFGGHVTGAAVQTRDREDAERLWQADDQRFARDLRVAPDAAAVLVAWAQALAARAARVADAAVARRFLHEADVKFAVARNLAAPGADALVAWGAALAALARRVEQTVEAERLWSLAAERFSTAARVQPDRSVALLAWAGELVARAERSADPADAARLFAEADAVFARALRIATGDYDALCDRAAALIAWAHLSDDVDESDALLDRAEEVARTALRIAPNETYTLACIAALRGHSEDCRAALEGAEAAATLPPPEHLAADEDLAAVRGEAWFQELLARRRPEAAH
ncbi:hypothetical protein CH341_00595 [Rhodoplanes roseus]|uniref:MalT-like TPR region domain-containing protein n=1 Tax=Rhodoplanes roseus TaxID=29409 RepID=A0A327L6W9_9BRAD|nr:hypothetical protein CH341_00595 [Rhodoplanes roseus]